MGPSWQARVAWGALHSWPEHDQRAVMHFPSREDLASSIWGSEVQAGRRSVGSAGEDLPGAGEEAGARCPSEPLSLDHGTTGQSAARPT